GPGAGPHGALPEGDAPDLRIPGAVTVPNVVGSGLEGCETPDEQVEAELEAVVVGPGEHRGGRGRHVREALRGERAEVVADRLRRGSALHRDLEHRGVEVSAEHVAGVRGRLVGQTGAAQETDAPLHDAEHVGTSGYATEREAGEVAVS